MKRQVILLLAGILLLACSACDQNGDSVQSEVLTPPAVSQPAEAVPESEPFAGAEAPAEEPLPTDDEETQRDSPEIPAVGSAPEKEEKDPPAVGSAPEEEEKEPPAVGSVPEGEEKDPPAADLQPDSPEVPTVSVDVDLTTLSSTMVYAEVFNMMMSPDDYIGKTIRMTGSFMMYQDPETKQVYCAVLVEDATACCAQGFDLAMPEELAYPQDYPTPESEVTVVGTLQADRTLEEYGIIFLRLENVTFESSAIS